MNNSLSGRGLGPAGLTAVRASLPVLLVLSGLCSAADPGKPKRAALLCSGWSMVVVSAGQEWKVESIKPPFTGARNLVATATGGDSAYMIMGQPMPLVVKNTFPPGKIQITWLDSNGRSQWKQRFELNKHAYYHAYWTKDAGPERTEEGFCTRQ